MNKTQEGTQVQETSDKQGEISSPKRVSPVVSKENQDSNSIKLTLSGAVQLTSPKLNKEATYHDKRKWDDSFTIAEKSEFTGNIVKASSKFFNHNSNSN
jgi:hypothetical protein